MPVWLDSASYRLMSEEPLALHTLAPLSRRDAPPVARSVRRSLAVALAEIAVIWVRLAAMLVLLMPVLGGVALFLIW